MWSSWHNENWPRKLKYPPPKSTLFTRNSIRLEYNPDRSGRRERITACAMAPSIKFWWWKGIFRTIRTFSPYCKTSLTEKQATCTEVYHHRHQHYWQNKHFLAIAFLRRSFQIESGFYFFKFRDNIFLQSKVTNLSSTPKPGWPGPCPHWQGGPVTTPGTVFLFRHLLKFAGLKWRYSRQLPLWKLRCICGNNGTWHTCYVAWTILRCLHDEPEVGT
jgi:hypothetical protein